MFKVEEDIFIFLSAYTEKQVQNGIKLWAKAFVKKKRAHFDLMREAGFEECLVPPDTYVTEDGRPIGRAFGKYWILSKELQDQRDYEAIEEEKKKPKPPISSTQETVSSVGEGLSAVLCPECTGVMSKQYLCSRCSKGKEGFKVLCICTECLHEVYL